MGSPSLANRIRRRILVEASNQAVYFYYTARPKRINPISYMRRMNEERAHALVQCNGELHETIESVSSRSGSTGCSYSDYWELYTHVRRLMPAYALECGSGISSAAIGLGMKHNLEESGRKGLLISMEEIEGYHAQIVDIFPTRLRDLVDFRLSNRVVKSYGSMQGVCYESVPDYPYEFVFVDGPNHRSPITGEKLFNSDFINVVLRSETPVVGIVDQRITTLWALKKLLPTASVRYYPTKSLTIIRNATRHDVRLPGQSR